MSRFDITENYLYPIIQEVSMGSGLVPKTQKITRFEKDGKRETKEIRLLAEDEVLNYRLLGTAQGADMFHCLYLAGRHCENFFEKVVGYYPLKPDERFDLAIAFYEELKSA